MSKPFKALQKDGGCSLIEFLIDISRWRGDPPLIIHLTSFDGFEEYLLGFFIWNHLDGTYYKVNEDGKKPKETLDDYVSLTDYGSLNNTTVRGESFMKSVFSIKLGRYYSPEKDVARWVKWIEKNKPSKYK